VVDSAEREGLAQRLEQVVGRIEEACQKSGRRPKEIRLIGATKGVAPERIRAAWAAGLREFGENYVRELTAKRNESPHATWHFWGRLQRNKVPRVVEAADVVHSLEPGRATDRLAEVAAERRDEVVGLVEVDFSGGRVGVTPAEAENFVERLGSHPGLRVVGLMTVPPLGHDPRPYFVRLRELRDRLGGLRELSMGMSGDYEEAVEEGATMVRIGTAIFGPRPGAVRGTAPRL
jgi:pyridoxal phosphate enzyme (YggS family)